MLAFKIPLAISAAVAGAYVMPPSTNQMLLVAQAIFGICVSFARFVIFLEAAGPNRRDSRGASPRGNPSPGSTGAGARPRRPWRHASRRSLGSRIR